ncbi:UNKNOWN [Stylonychia lemnae]|uniref:Uncharacterized protein n=1 Tax=Stylonychia lemnae TaxID=5949 RepID=A0A078AIT4_STYLE|nr:UNKNOWN [Stylonychia lemnae]|eukprot:CDW82205.1 UNKNOWN [Stylonychia lemnae]
MLPVHTTHLKTVHDQPGCRQRYTGDLRCDQPGWCTTVQHRKHHSELCCGNHCQPICCVNRCACGIEPDRSCADILWQRTSSTDYR